MAEQIKLSFFDEIVQIVILYSLIPLCILSICFFCFSYVYFDTAILGENRKENSSVTNSLGNLYKQYSEILYSKEISIDVSQIKEDEQYSRRLLTDAIKLMNAKANMADFYLFDEEYNLVLTTANEVLHFMPPAVGENWGLVNKMKNNFGIVKCSFFKGFFLIGKSLKDGYAVFVIPQDFFNTYLLNKHSSILILDRYNDVCLSSNNLFLGSFNSIKTEVLYTGQFFTYKDDWFFKTINSLYMGGELFSFYAFSPVKRAVTLLILEGFGLICLVGLGGFLSISKAVKRIDSKTKSISKIVKGLEEVQQGNFNKRIEVESNDEFKIIADSYNTMTAGMEELLQRNKEILEETVAVQIKELESQFNPHFLFNTLETIKYMTKLEPQNVPVIINNFSKLLRYSINIQDSGTTLAEDLEYIKNYLYIQKIRFTDRFEYDIDVDYECFDCVVPKLILQPLIENAIVYNISESKEKRKVEIFIKAVIEDENLCITVSDNGMGITPEKIKEINEFLKKEKRTTNHFGMYNVNKRLKLIYGENACFQIKSSINEGTVVYMSFPAKYQEKDYV